MIERVATSSHVERVVIGSITRGRSSIGYLLASRSPMDVTDIVSAQFVDLGKPFEHLAD
jgi:hypothetical protein